MANSTELKKTNTCSWTKAGQVKSMSSSPNPKLKCNRLTALEWSAVTHMGRLRRLNYLTWSKHPLYSDAAQNSKDGIGPRSIFYHICEIPQKNKIITKLQWNKVVGPIAIWSQSKWKSLIWAPWAIQQWPGVSFGRRPDSPPWVK